MPFWDYPRGPAGARTLVHAGRDRGLSPERCLRGSGLAIGDLVQDVTVSGIQELQVMRNVNRASNNAPGIGVDAGRRINSGSIGIFGYALLTSPTWKEAMIFAVRYARLSLLFLQPSVTIDRHAVWMNFDDRDVPADINDLATERDLAGSAAVLSVMVPTSTLQLHTRLTGSSADALQTVAPNIDVHSGKDRQGFRASLAVANRRLPEADALALRYCEQWCVATLERRGAQQGSAARVRAHLLQNPTRKLTMQEVAAELHVEERTLRRQLRAETTSFRSISDDVRSSYACELLDAGSLTVQEVGDRLGYYDAASFTHAFKRWTGKTPGATRLHSGERDQTLAEKPDLSSHKQAGSATKPARLS